VLELDEPGNLDFAGTAPRRPEIEEDHLASEGRQLDVFVVEIFQREVQVGGLGVRGAPGARWRRRAKTDSSRDTVPRRPGIRRQRQQRERQRADGRNRPSSLHRSGSISILLRTSYFRTCELLPTGRATALPA